MWWWWFGWAVLHDQHIIIACIFIIIAGNMDHLVHCWIQNYFFYRNRLTVLGIDLLLPRCYLTESTGSSYIKIIKQVLCSLTHKREWSLSFQGQSWVVKPTESL